MTLCTQVSGAPGKLLMGMRERSLSYRRADEAERIYVEAAPAVSSAISGSAREFLHSLHTIVREAVEDSGGHFE